jgi:hypothetical protein
MAIGLVDIVLLATMKMGSRDELARQTVTPGMVRTDKFFAVTGVVYQPGAAVTTDVVKSADNAVFCHHQHDGLPGERNRLHVARVDKLVAETGEHPVVTKNGLLLQLVKVGAGVGQVGQSGTLGDRLFETSIPYLLQKIGLYLSLGCAESGHLSEN